MTSRYFNKVWKVLSKTMNVGPATQMSLHARLVELYKLGLSVTAAANVLEREYMLFNAVSDYRELLTSYQSELLHHTNTSLLTKHTNEN